VSCLDDGTAMRFDKKLMFKCEVRTVRRCAWNDGLCKTILLIRKNQRYCDPHSKMVRKETLRKSQQKYRVKKGKTRT
jgi:hypothetical protein